MSDQVKSVKDIRNAEEFRNEALSVLRQKGIRQVGRNYFETTVPCDRRAREVLDKIFFRQKIIHNIQPSTETTFLGHSLKTPIMIAPMASMATLFEDGVGTMCAATHEAGSMTWMAFHSKDYYSKHAKTHHIVYIEKPLTDRDKLLEKLKTAEQEGCAALGIDVDSGADSAATTWGPLKSLSVEELREIRKNLSKPFIIKGVLSVDDAAKAVEVGAKVIVVSNHYGTKLDYAQAPMEVLPEIVDAVGDKIDVLVDGQIRTGSDVLKALAMGAKAVLVGRPLYWAELVGGSEGMVRLIQIMTAELRKAMLYTGVKSVTKVPRDILALPKDIY